MIVLKIGTFFPSQIFHSSRIYVDNISKEIEGLGANIIRFSEKQLLPEDVDLYWDPRSAGGLAPYRALINSGKPVVVTVHGTAPFSMKWREFYQNFLHALVGRLHNIKKFYDWHFFYNRIAAAITVSNYAKKEIMQHLKIKGENIFSIYHGVDHNLFRPATHSTQDESYLLHVSMYQPKKNINRLFIAYESLSMIKKPRLIAVVPGFSQRYIHDGIKLICDKMSHEKLLPLYQNAVGFVFPSLHETFGMPILEAMACGCPVITSNDTACGEVAGDAALLVNPRSVEEITSAMDRLITDKELQKTFRNSAIQRADTFTWQKSAEAHLSVFNKAIGAH
jgi:glycosyltransferase involved in cell wall biosynthesis